MHLKRFLVLAFLSTAVAYSASATHLRAGEITIRRQSCTSLTFVITITVYTNTESEIRFGSGTLDYGDGSKPLITPRVENTLRPDLGPGIGTVSYSVSHTYSGPGYYVVSYLEPNRNAGILNMFNSVDTPFYLESTVSIDPFLGCDNSPRLLIPPIDKACTSAAWYHNPGAYDPDGDSLSYEFTVPKSDRGIPVNNYRDPNAKEFYDRIGLNYNTANETGNGPPTFTINSITGTIIWNAPGAPGQYNIAFIIREWRKVSGIWVNNGYVVRDMQIIVEDCRNKRPELTVPADICVEAGTSIHQSIFGTDPDFDPVKIEAFSQILNQDLSHPFPNPATYTPFPAVFQPTVSPNIAKIDFAWDTKCAHVKEQPYQVVFKITDKPPANKGTQLVQFKTWNIKVVGPAPQWNTAVVVPNTRNASLSWQTYTCQNATTMQIWRRIGSLPYTQVQCVTGMPDNLGFTLLKEVPITQNTYLDKNLAVGAQFCYRLVAVFPQPGGGESYVSNEICVPSIPANAPVITNVTIDKTSTTAGNITIVWRPPFQINQGVFPPPYRYLVLRADGLAQSSTYSMTHTGTLPDTMYTDTGMNSAEKAFNYKVVLYSNTNQPLDTSAIASTVRLELKPQFKQIELDWVANVPWSNQSQKFPTHQIYRGKPGDTESQLVLIDNVTITSGKFTYTDAGQWNGVPLDEKQVYCYRVKTQGTYDNPRIVEPLINYSEIICAQPNDDKAPCQPSLSIVAFTCDQVIQTLSCDPKVFSNTLTWKRPADLECRQDIAYYNIYVAKQLGAEFELYVKNVTDTFYVDANLPSYARCYKISALDRAGNESELSEQFCFDNCPNYELPNVFTPNGDNCNEVFSAYSGREVIDEAGYGPCGKIDPQEVRLHCARFVESVKFTVTNRWGKEVYNYQSGGEKSIYIDWDGNDNNGKEVPAGTYYYSAEVTFNVVDPSKKVRNIKGWVQLVR